MLFETLNQDAVFLSLLYFGFLSGIVDQIFKPLSSVKNKFFKFFGDTIRPVILGVLFFVAVCVCNFGEFRIYLVLAFLLGFFLEKQLFAKPLTTLTKKLISFFKKIKFSRKNKNST